MGEANSTQSDNENVSFTDSVIVLSALQALHPANVNLLISTQNEIGKNNFSSVFVQKHYLDVEKKSWTVFQFHFRRQSA